MSDTLDTLDEVLSTGALLRATLNPGTESAGLYDKARLVDMLELQAERLRLIFEAEECCGFESGPMCGCCKNRLEDAAHKRGQIHYHWERAA